MLYILRLRLATNLRLGFWSDSTKILYYLFLTLCKDIRISDGGIDDWQSHSSTSVIASHQIIVPEHHSAMMTTIKSCHNRIRLLICHWIRFNLCQHLFWRIRIRPLTMLGDLLYCKKLFEETDNFLHSIQYVKNGISEGCYNTGIKICLFLR